MVFHCMAVNLKDLPIFHFNPINWIIARYSAVIFLMNDFPTLMEVLIVGHFEV